MLSSRVTSRSYTAECRYSTRQLGEDNIVDGAQYRTANAASGGAFTILGARTAEDMTRHDKLCRPVSAVRGGGAVFCRSGRPRHRRQSPTSGNILFLSLLRLVATSTRALEIVGLLLLLLLLLLY